MLMQYAQIWRSGLRLWEDAADKAPLMPETHYNHGCALHNAGDIEGALAAYMRAIDLNPNNVLAQNNVGAIYQKRGRFSEDIQAYCIALTVKPDVAETLNNLGFCYNNLGRRTEALQL